MKPKNMIIPMFAVLALSAFGNDSVETANKDWEGTSEYFQPTDAAGYDIFYNPAVGYVGDPMPFYDPVNKDFKIFYLQEFRPNAATFHPFWCLSTTDGASYTNLGELIPTGTQTEQDGALGTGSTIYNEADGTYYTFYTGHSVNVAATRLVEAVMLATSKDFKTWEKDSNFFLSGEGEYSTADFRDPFVFKGDDGKFHMLVSTQKNGKGVIAEYVSTDLKDWESNGVFMTMMWDRFYECPDVFKMGDWWYLVYSEKHAAVRRVQYFKGRTLDELKATTANDAGLWPDSHEGMLDSRAFYAGKTASDGVNRYIWGWCPTRPGNDNTNVGAFPAEPSWAGALVAHRVIQHEDGTLTLGAVDAIADRLSKEENVKIMKQDGNVSGTPEDLTIREGGYALFNRLSTENNISFKVKSDNPDVRFGISFGRGSDSEKYYTVVINPEGEGRHKINFEEEGPAGIGFINGADGYVFNNPTDNVYDVRIYTDNSVCTVYINDNVAYTMRIYGIQKNCWSINSYNSTIKVTDISVKH